MEIAIIVAMVTSALIVSNQCTKPKKDEEYAGEENA